MNKPDDFDCWRLPDDGSVAKCASHCMPRRTRHTISSAELTTCASAAATATAG